MPLLLAGPECPQARALLVACKKKDDVTAAFYDPAYPGTRPTSGAKAAHGGVFSWNPGSPISARAVALHAEQRFRSTPGASAAALLLCVPSLVYSGHVYTPGICPQPAEVDAALDTHIKSCYYMAAELCRLFERCGGGRLAMALWEDAPSEGVSPPPLAGAIAEAFHALGDSLVAAADSGKAPFSVLAFSAQTHAADTAFADYIADNLYVESKGAAKSNRAWGLFKKKPRNW